MNNKNHFASDAYEYQEHLDEQRSPKTITGAQINSLNHELNTGHVTVVYMCEGPNWNCTRVRYNDRRDKMITPSGKILDVDEFE